MEQRRLLLFFVSAMAILIVWTQFLAPVFFPMPQQPQQGQQVAQNEEENGADANGEQDDGEAEQQKDDEPPQADDQPGEDTRDESPQVAGGNDNEQPPPDEEQPDEPEPQAPSLVDDWNPDQVPHRSVTLGTVEEQTGYFMEVVLTSKGAGVLELRLSDPRYVELDNQNTQLELIRSENRLPPTLGTVFYDQEQPAVGIADQAALIEWEVARDENGDEMLVEDPQHAGIFQSVTFRGVFPELGVEVLKTFSLHASDKEDEEELEDARRTDIAGYQLVLDVEIRNLTSQPRDVHYHLQGPVGVPIEGQENSRTFKQRQIAVGFLEPDGSVDDEVLPAEDLIEKIDNNRPEQWTGAIRYIGVDVQYFASLIVPEDQNQDQTYATAIPMVVDRAQDPEFSDISVVLQSRRLSLLPAGEKFPDGEPGDVISQQVKLFAGPKREALLAEMDADPILNYGRFGILAGVMIAILNWLHWVGIPYGIAIVILTLIVRSCLYPLSRKQALGAKKMKELQPKLNEIKKKYAKDKEKQAKAQMELFRKHNYNPLAGCLPLLLQFPIFISLYSALSISVDLRLAPFLWIDNLAAPDHLFNFGFALPFLGNWFNLLPILTIVLFIGQMKMFQPPPQTEEQRLQYKMMTVMPVVMGFIFYSVPAGLCIYFITSSLWGMAERKLLDYGKPAEEQQPAPEKKSKVKA